MEKKDDLIVPMLDMLESIIPVGRNRAVSRETLCKIMNADDRVVRSLISYSSKPIINLGEGYFVPDMDDYEDVRLLGVYVAKEQERIHSLTEKLNRKFSEYIPETPMEE